ncbi:MAG: hypothetical protein QME66_13905 [Candidatus Eisenbacteria bacterium]|nr:hypothetical protein [Candidatus Eisenbacteria bacterium]
MKARTSKWLALVVPLVLLLAGVAFLLIARSQSPRRKLYEAIFVNAEAIRKGIARFDIQYERLPTNLAEVVNAGLLPAVSPIYSCPVAPDQAAGQQMSYCDTQYEMQFGPQEILITVPRQYVSVGPYPGIIKGDPSRYCVVRYQKGSVIAVGPFKRE